LRSEGSCASTVEKQTCYGAKFNLKKLAGVSKSEAWSTLKEFGGDVGCIKIIAR